MVDARLPDGCRVNAIIPPLARCAARCSPSGSSPRTRYTAKRPHQLRHAGPSTWSRSWRRCVRGQASTCLVSGGTGTGKTTNAQRPVGLHPGGRADPHDRGRRRAPAPAAPRAQPGGPAGEHRGPGARSRSATWSRTPCACGPTGIIVGEVRGAEALDMLQAMNTGHEGSLTHGPRQLAARRPRAPRDDGADGRLRPAGPGHPPAGRRRPRHDPPRRPDARRHAASSPRLTEIQGMEGETIRWWNRSSTGTLPGTVGSCGRASWSPHRPPTQSSWTS